MPTAVPSITSAATATGSNGFAFSYQIVAINNPTAYNASPLPAGLIIDTDSGLIYGTPTATGVTSITLTASNAVGTATKTLALSIVNQPIPVITSGTLARGVLGSSFTYAITATNSVTSYWTSGLPAGLYLNSQTGIIMGQAMQTGTFNMTVGAVNTSGTGKINLSVTISPAYYWSNFAGLPGQTGTADGTGTSARFYHPYGVAVDSGSNIYVADSSNNIVRKITPAGVVTTLAGTPGVSGTADGLGSAAEFSLPTGIGVDSGGNVYVADNGNYTIRKITPDGGVTTLAGTPGSPGIADGQGSAAGFFGSQGVAVDSSSNVYVADSMSNTIRKITPAGVVTTLAGTSGTSGTADGLGSVARFHTPMGIAVDGGSNLYVADLYNYTIRKVTPAGLVTTLAGNSSGVFADGLGSSAGFSGPRGIAVDSSGNVYVTDFYGNTLRKMVVTGTSWMVTTIGSAPSNSGTADGLGSAAQFRNPAAIAVDNGGNTYVADEMNSRISKGVLSPPPVIGGTLAATGAIGSAFSYQIAASNNPSSYVANGLPLGLTVDTASGLISGTPTVSGIFTPTLSVANPGGTGTAMLTLTVLSVHDAWKAQKFTAAQLLDPAMSGDSAIPSGDGISNLMKYALGLNPNTRYASSSVLPYAQVQAVGGTNYLTLTFTQNTSAADVTYSVEASTTLNGTWTEINPLLPANQVSVLPDTPSSGINTITVKDVQPASTSTRRFMRLRVTNP